MKKVNRDWSTRVYSYPHALKILVLTIVPILLSTTIYQLNSIIGQLIYAQYYGEGYEAIWGSFTGQYQLLIHVPTAIAAAIGASIIPSLTRAVEHHEFEDARAKMASAIRFNMVIAIPATVGLAVLAAPILSMLFRRTDTDLAVQMMGVVFTDKGFQFPDKLAGFVFCDEFGGLNRIHKQLQFRQLKSPGQQVVAPVPPEFYLDDVQPISLKLAEIGI